MQAGAGVSSFGCFSVDAKRRKLSANGAPVALNARAFDLLLYLIDNRGRVVGRDEILAHVWQGVTVGENNLSVQLSALRRTLAEHAGGEPLIVNLPGRGYRFVAEIDDNPVPNSAPDSAPDSRPTPDLPLPGVAGRPPGRAAAPGRRARLLPLAALLMAGLVAAAGALAVATALRSWLGPSPPDGRLSVAVEPLVPIGRDPRAAALAGEYTDAVLSRFAQFEDLTLFDQPAPGQRGGPQPHFRLAGSLRLDGDGAVITIGLTEAATGRLLMRDSTTVPTGASLGRLHATAMQLLMSVRPALFGAEHAMRRGPPRDSLDLVIDAHVAAGGFEPPELRQAMALSEQAVRRDPASRPARAQLATLLVLDMLARDAREGDAEGLRALGLIDSNLREEPRNFLYLELRAYALSALDRLEEAEATAREGLRIEPEFDYLLALLGEILLQKGELGPAAQLFATADRSGDSYPGDDRQAMLAFAGARYEDALSVTRRALASGPFGWSLRNTALLQIATLSQLGSLREAAALLARVLAASPPGPARVSGLRQSAFLLPDRAWGLFRHDLVLAGMPPLDSPDHVQMQDPP